MRACLPLLRAQPRLVLLRRVNADSRLARYSSKPPDNPRPEDILSTPTWSVEELLPDPNAPVVDSLSEELTLSKLRHLLRLSALPVPKDDAEEQKMLDTLTSQLHFVRSVQSVDTTGVEPLTSIRDETPEAVAEAEFTADKLRPLVDAANERNLQRKKRKTAAGPRETVPAEDWDVLGQAQRKQGRYFVVDSPSRPSD